MTIARKFKTCCLKEFSCFACELQIVWVKILAILILSLVIVPRFWKTNTFYCLLLTVRQPCFRRWVVLLIVFVIFFTIFSSMSKRWQIRIWKIMCWSSIWCLCVCKIQLKMVLQDIRLVSRHQRIHNFKTTHRGVISSK